MNLSIVRILMATALAVFISGCSMGPQYSRPKIATDIPDLWADGADRQALIADQGTDVTLAEAASGTSDNWRWWESFGDPTLNQLVTDAIAYNNDLAVAAGRVLEAQAALGGAKSALWPTLEVGGMANRSRNIEAPTGGMGSPYSNLFSASVTGRYEADLWGRLASGKEAALTTALASEQNRRAVAQGVITAVVQTWLVINELEMQVKLNDQTVANFTNSLKVVRERYERGLVSPLDVHLASQNLASAKAAGPSFKQNRATYRRQLEILVGRYPAGKIAVSENTIQMPAPLPAVPVGLPSELLERRPDVLSAELQLRASNARIGEAKAGLYPRISLTAEAGSKSTDLADLLTDPTKVWTLAGNLFMPLLNRGQTQAQIKAAEARVLQASAQYRSTVLNAFAQVENALDLGYYQQQQETFLTDSVEQARRSLGLAEERYQRGLENLLVVLETQRRLYNAESQLLTTQRVHRTARVVLIQALGGPWENLSQGAN